MSGKFSKNLRETALFTDQNAENTEKTETVIIYFKERYIRLNFEKFFVFI